MNIDPADAPDRPELSHEPSQSAAESPLVVLCTVVDDIEGKLVVGLLRSEGIEALASADLDPGVHPVGTSDSSSVLVLEQQLPQARRILEEHQLHTFAVVVILAAGQGERMGGPKGVLPIGQRSLVEELVEAYSASLVREIVVVVAPDSPVAGKLDADQVTIVVNPDPSRGPLSSLWAALDELEGAADAILVQPVDVPMFDVEVIDDLIRRFERAESPILVPTFEGRRGHPLLLGKQCLDFVRRASLEVGLRQVLHDNPELVREVPVSAPGVAVDLNTPDELESFLKTYQAKEPDLE